MSQSTNGGLDPNDPFGTLRTIRDANLDAWAKGMTSLVGSDTFAKAIGLQLDTMLAATAPVQNAVQQTMESYLAQANMPSRNEVASLASRLTNIEIRLDDMQAQLDTILTALQTLTVSITDAGETKAAASRRARKASE